MEFLGKLLLSDKEYEEAIRGVYELERDDYIQQDPTQSSDSFKILTERGLREVENELADMKLPSLNIDELISRDDLRNRVRDDYIAGDYESAIFKAFRLLEESVRKKAGQPASAIGVNLITTVFKPGASLLKHPEAQVASEEESLFYLMRGAIGWFKNPSSHRTVGYDDDHQAAHILGFANLLLDLLDQCSK